MKIRIFDDSIRLRLDRSEVDAIGRGESVECATRFADGGAFKYQLAIGETPDALDAAARFTDGCIAVTLRDANARAWATDDTAVSIVAAQQIADGELSLLIEKDFECLDPREGEDQSNRFKNPKAAG